MNGDASASQDRYRRFASMENRDARLQPFLQVTYARGKGVDSTPPSVSLASPGVGAALAGVVMLEATQSDDTGVVAVGFTVDGIRVGERTAAPYALSWDTTATGDGVHTLIVIARDAAGNMGASAPVKVIVDNGITR
jgi:hypothetical protein